MTQTAESVHHLEARARVSRGGWALRFVRLHPEWTISPILLVGAIALWDLLVKSTGVSPTIVPGPGRVWIALSAGLNRPLNAPDGWYLNSYYTLVEALGGFAMGSIAGIVLALIVTQSRFIERILMPYIVGFQAVPKIAVAPLFVIWFGLGISAKMYLGATITFFPVLVSAMAGFTAVDAEPLQMMRSYRATRLQIFRLLQFPYSLPYIFAGLEVAIVFSLVAAVVGEFMGGADGLGAYIQAKQGIVDIPAVFAALIVLGVLGTVLYVALRVVRRKLLFWSAQQSSRISL